MTQSNLFNEDGSASPEARPADPSADCSAEALDKVDTARLERLTEQEYLLSPEGAIAEDIVERLRLLGITSRGNLVTIGSIRPRQTALKDREILFATGARRKNAAGNSCAVLIHRKFWDIAPHKVKGSFAEFDRYIAGDR